MSILRVLWAPFAFVGHSVGRYWFGTGPRDTDGWGPDGPREPGAAAVAWRACEPLVVLALVAAAAALLAAGALSA